MFEEKISIKIDQGTVIGRKSKLPNGSSYSYFRGIPYAQPPIGKLRFKVPQPLEKFKTDELDCSKEGNSSYQRNLFNEILGSEDCLYLNVYMPTAKTKPLAVMVWIHGGSFSMGSGNSDLYNPIFLLQENVIVVTLNYRVGILGFLSFPEGGIPGNLGLKDQLFALKWVQKNIHHFNGDPSNITLFGESAGGVSVHLHVHSENSNKYFHKAIIQSGTFNSYWAVRGTRNASANAKRLAELLGCKSSSDREIGEFLRDYQYLAEMYKNYNRALSQEERKYESVPFNPVIEPLSSSNSIITEDPVIVMAKQNSVKIPIMMGYTSGEGVLFASKTETQLKRINSEPAKIIPMDLEMNDTAELAMKIRKFYIEDDEICERTLQNYANLLGDSSFVYGIQIAAGLHAKNQPMSNLYFYKFAYEGGRNFHKKFTGLEHLKGVSHSEELFYLFKADIFENEYNQANKTDEKVTKTMCKLWTNFAKYGNPISTMEPDSLNVQWSPIQNNGNLDYMEIDKKLRMTSNPDREGINFWKEIYRKHGSLKIKSNL